MFKQLVSVCWCYLICICLRSLVVATPTLSVTNAAQLNTAAETVIQNLLALYQPNADGVYNQIATPWFASGMIWDMILEYTRWTGNKGNSQFANTAIGALASISYGPTADILDGANAQLQGLEGKWNDDILWPALAMIDGAEIYGPQTTMPGINAPWITVPAKTLWEAYSQSDTLCGGGIYWSRDRAAANSNYKSSITNTEFIHNSARVYIQTKNQTNLDQATQIWNWVVTSSGLASTETGQIYDGVDTTACQSPNTASWSYQYGQIINAAVWMHKATGQQTYLDAASTFLATSVKTFAPNNIITETCEAAGNCNRDAQHFKGSYARALAFLFRETSKTSDKQLIQSVIGASITRMLSNCDNNWICGGNWTTNGGPVNYVADLHASSSLLVAALGVYTSTTGTGILPSNLDLGAPNVSSSTTSNSPGSGNSNPNTGSVESSPLNSATSHSVNALLCLTASVATLILI